MGKVKKLVLESADEFTDGSSRVLFERRCRLFCDERMHPHEFSTAHVTFSIRILVELESYDIVSSV